jgi:hypothetical protein
MSAATPSPLAHASSVPELAFSVLDASPFEHTAVPTLRFGVRVDAGGGAAIRSILLHTQVKIAARRRAYGAEVKERLFDLFGPAAGWAGSLSTLLWAQHTQVVPPFTAEAAIDVPVPCTYDFDVAASRYLAALDGGDVPLELLFSGTVFYAGEDGALQTGRIPWDREAEYRMPVAVWRATMERHFADTAWLRLRTDTLERLQAYRSRGALTSLDAAIESLLEKDR